MTRPLVTVIVTAFNRSHTVGRTLRSILTQTYDALDVVVVDDGSTDDTVALVEAIQDPRIRLLRHPSNRGAQAAKNTGLASIRGAWFTFVDSDDEIVPDAIEQLMRVPLTMDPRVTKVECNALHVESGTLSGKGLSGDQYLEMAKVEGSARGDFWGITRTDLLGGERFNEHLKGLEGILWSKVRARALEYFLDRPLLRIHADGGARLSKGGQDVDDVASFFHYVAAEHEWLELRRKYRPAEYVRFCFRGMLFSLAANDQQAAWEYRRRYFAETTRGRDHLLARLLFVTAPLGPRMAITLTRTARGVNAASSRKAETA